MLSCESLLLGVDEGRSSSSLSSAEESMKETLWGAISSSSGAGTLVWGRLV